MKYVHRFGELGHIDNPKRAGRLSNADFFHALTHRVQGLPVICILTVLHLIDLMARLTSGCERKGAQVIQGSTPELNGLGIAHGLTIQKFVCACKLSQWTGVSVACLRWLVLQP